MEDRKLLLYGTWSLCTMTRRGLTYFPVRILINLGKENVAFFVRKDVDFVVVLLGRIQRHCSAKVGCRHASGRGCVIDFLCHIAQVRQEDNELTRRKAAAAVAVNARKKLVDLLHSSSPIGSDQESP